MTQQTRIVGETVAEIVIHELDRISAAPGSTAPSARITSFAEAEIPHIVARLRGHQLPGRRAPLDLVVASNRSIAGVSADCLLREGATVTTHRNLNQHGLVVVECDRQSDHQGLRNMWTVTDRSLLQVDDEEERASRLRRLLNRAWSTCRQATTPTTPEELHLATAAIYKHLSSVAEVPLRRWVAYLEECCSRFSDVAEAIPPDDSRAAASESLFALGLFPDASLFDETSRIARRLQKNHYYASLQNASGKPVPDDELFRRIETTSFVDTDQQPLDDARQRALRSDARRVVEGEGDSARRTFSYELWAQLFEVKVRRAGLGAQIHAAIEQAHPERLAEYLDMEVEQPLDEGDPATGELFLRAEANVEGEAALYELLPRTLQKRVEKLAIPRVSAESDPLRGLLYGLRAVEDESATARVLELRWERIGETDGQLSRALFAFLYGRTLAELAEGSEGTVGHTLRVDERLLNVSPDFAGQIPIESDADTGRTDAEFDAPRDWKPLRLALANEGERSAVSSFEWRPLEAPGLAALAHIILESERADCFRSSLSGLEAWCESALDPTQALDGALSVESGGLPGEWLDLRRECFGAWQDQGLGSDELLAYVDGWRAILARARQNLVPRGAPVEELGEFLRIDTLNTNDGRISLLATHPLRLRWLGVHLREMGATIRQSLEQQLELNAQNDGLYFDWLDRLSPHKQPPFLSFGDGGLAIATREFGLHEEYAAIQRDGSEARDWVSSIDDGAIDELARIVRSYLDSYPHKVDGLSVLVLDREGDAQLPRRLATQVRRKDYAFAVVQLHVVSPRRFHDNLMWSLAELESEDERGELLLPSFQLHLHDWADVDETPDLSSLHGLVDIALAPNLFGTYTRAQEQTRPDVAHAEGFDPWVGSTSHVEDVWERDPSQNVSHVLLPERSDALLEAWSTISVRHYRNTAVSPRNEDAVDYLTLQVRFDRNRALFESLHHVAHWVVTLDPFIGRDQVDAMPERPDVITIKAGVGKNETYTLIVSSSAGREFIASRLERKLTDHMRLESATPAREIAFRLYDLGRNTAPGVVLRALGLGRSTQEILGLLISRYAVEELYPRPEAASFEAWIGLDEYLHWFGGPQHPRADLLRVTGSRENEDFRLRFDVVESKFRARESYERAEQQVSRTVDLVRAAFSRTGDEEPADARFWRRELVAALDQASKQCLPPADFPALMAWEQGQQRGGLSRADRQALQTGAYSVESVNGVICAIAYEEGGTSYTEQTADEFALVHIRRPEVERTLERLVARELPVPGRSWSAAGKEVRKRASESDGTAREHDPADVDVEAIGRPEAIEPQDPGDGGSRAGLGVTGLEHKYQVVLDAFSEFKVPIARPPGERHAEGPGFYLLRVVPKPGVKTDNVMNRVPELKLRLGLNAEQQIRSYIDQGSIVFEIPKGEDERYAVFAEDLWARCPRREDALYVPIGEDIRGGAVGLDFSSNETPHLLIAGTTGSGKSVALDTILHGLCLRYTPEQLRLHLVDPKETELVDFEGAPHLDGTIGGFADEALAILEQAVAEMQRRYRLLREARTRSLNAYNAKRGDAPLLPWRLVVLDEYADLTSDPDDKKQIEQSLKRLAQKARACGIHVVIATQKPSAEVLSTTIRSNLPAQLALRVKTSVDSRIILDEAGAETLSGKGDAFLRTNRGMTRLQCAVRRSLG